MNERLKRDAIQTKSEPTLRDYRPDQLIDRVKGPWGDALQRRASKWFQVHLIDSRNAIAPVRLQYSDYSRGRSASPLYVQLRKDESGIKYALIHVGTEEKPHRVDFDGFLQEVRSIAAAQLTSIENADDPKELVFREIEGLPPQARRGV